MKNFMKQFITILMLVMTLGSSAANYFTEGTEWKVRFWTSYPYEPMPYNVIYSLENPSTVAGHECLELYSMTEGDPASKQPVCLLRPDGDKVYMLSDGPEPRWDLIYDFGLQPGETARIRWTITPERWGFVECREITTHDVFKGFPVIITEEYCDELPDLSMRTGIWLIGIGGSGGPLNNVLWDLCGGGESALQSVTVNGEEIFISNLAIDTAERDQNAQTAPAKYFDIQGRPASPDKPGIYIRKAAGSTSKAIVR